MSHPRVDYLSYLSYILGQCLPSYSTMSQEVVLHCRRIISKCVFNQVCQELTSVHAEHQSGPHQPYYSASFPVPCPNFLYTRDSHRHKYSRLVQWVTEASEYKEIEDCEARNNNSDGEAAGKAEV